jgi:hypothetical protein
MDMIIYSASLAFIGLAANHKYTIALGWLACGISMAMIYFL